MSHVRNTPVEHDWRFAELIARSWMEPQLAVRYAADPCRVLAEFGLKVTRREDAPALEPYSGPDLIVEDLEHARGHHMGPTVGFCGTDPQDEGSEPQAAPVVVRRLAA
jgi:hypothetical protein